MFPTLVNVFGTGAVSCPLALLRVTTVSPQTDGKVHDSHPGFRNCVNVVLCVCVFLLQGTVSKKVSKIKAFSFRTEKGVSSREMRSFARNL